MLCRSSRVLRVTCDTRAAAVSSVRDARAVTGAVGVHAHDAPWGATAENRVPVAHVWVLWHVGCVRGSTACYPSHVSRLTSHQVLQLWDRVIAYDSLLPIPVLAAAVFVFRFQTIFARVTRYTPHV